MPRSELAQDRARLLNEEIARRVAEATNRNLFVLSVVTAVLLPLTLITGLFGMNVTIPWGDDSNGFWWIVGVMGLSLVVSLWALRTRRLL